MASPEHVAVVRQGADAIKRWREKHPHARLDLRGAALFRADLTSADLDQVRELEAQLGVAVQLGTVRFRGTFLADPLEAPPRSWRTPTA